MSIKKCKDCGVSLRVKDTREVDNTIIRRRVCPTCGRQYFTAEEPIRPETGRNFLNDWQRDNYKRSKNDK